MKQQKGWSGPKVEKEMQTYLAILRTVMQRQSGEIRHNDDWFCNDHLIVRLCPLTFLILHRMQYEHISMKFSGENSY
jgi:hypothetical protein